MQVEYRDYGGIVSKCRPEKVVYALASVQDNRIVVDPAEESLLVDVTLGGHDSASLIQGEFLPHQAYSLLDHPSHLCQYGLFLLFGDRAVRAVVVV